MSGEAANSPLRHLLPPGRDLENGKGDNKEDEEGQQAARNRGGNGRLDTDSRDTFGGSFQEDAPAPYDAAPPLSRAPSTVHSVHLRDLKPGDLFAISRLRITNRDLEEPPPPPHRNPVVRALRWWRSWALPGAGMFIEAWMIFAIGNIKPLLAIDMPNCFGHQQPYSCDQTASDSVTYVEVSGIIVGMLALGFFADIIGRKWGSRLASTTMLAWAASTLWPQQQRKPRGSTSVQLASQTHCFLPTYAGVGGEYPVASSSAAEKAEGSKAMRRRRGEAVVLVFSQQGWGNLANTLCIVLLLVMQGATDEVTPQQANITWRVQFAVGTAICLAVVVYRWTLLQESKVWKAERHDVAEQLAQKGMRAHHSQQEYKLVIRYYWPRVFATSLAWAAGGFAFYGQKLFQAQFIKMVVPGATVLQQMLYILLNNGVALVGYYCAAALIDRPWCGRMRMQAGGFFMLFLLFLLQGALFSTLENHSGAFQLLYYLSSFFAQLGPNCTTFLTAGEVYPTGVRSFFHGISAAAGKVGALAAAVLFSNISPRAAFYASAGAGLAGLLVTLGFLPDTTGLDLHEIDRMNRYLLADQYSNYRGEAVNPRYLSLFERWRRYDAHYHPEADFAHKELQLHPHLQEAAESLASLSRQASLASIRLSPGSPSSVRLSLFGRPSSVQLTPRSPKPPSSARLGRPASVQLTPVSFELQLTPVATRPASAAGQRLALGQPRAPSSAHLSQRSPRMQRQESKSPRQPE
ncbi:hypothetical protein COHA_001492 [Chlorella ohadii]|uniref:Major facilitator superfamily (MFS) profile domain-containing protein n=1 Tax=Chlorella ohadii TaxID=2649997 RepID=A0AAD5DYC3_9CHLO|nr:hypothetical protein COHA_001492 [Chlorella ohadii]